MKAGATMRNWSGHVEFTSTGVTVPANLSELQLLVGSSARIRALGTAHSFNAIADTTGIHVSVAGLDSQIDIDSRASVAWVPAAMRYGEVARLLDAQGWAIPNMA